MLYHGHPIKVDVRRAVWSVLAMPRGFLGEDLKYFNFECMEDHYSSLRHLKVRTRAQLEYQKLSGDLHSAWDMRIINHLRAGEFRYA